MALTNGLLALPERYLDATKRAYYTGFKSRIPPFPIASAQGHPVFAPAQSWETTGNGGGSNVEFPNMYPAFPFCNYPIGSPGFDTLLNTWNYGAFNPAYQKQNICWFQSNIFTARLGLTDESAKYSSDKFLHSSLRFPAFWETGGFDQQPDFDHGGSAMVGLQEMLMQCDGTRILLGAAWPKEWNCVFKLNAPYQTIVEGKVENGKVTVTTVTPASRTADISIVSLKEGPGIYSASSNWSSDYSAVKASDGDTTTRWSAAPGDTSPWLQIDFGSPTSINKAVIKETSYPRVTKFTLTALQTNGTWQIIAQGTTIGAYKELNFASITATTFRLNMLQFTGVPTIDEFKLFGTAIVATKKSVNSVKPNRGFILRVTRDKIYWNAVSAVPVQWEIHDLQGRTVLHCKNDRSSGPIQLQNLAAGAYGLTFREAQSRQLLYHALIMVP